MKPRFRNERHSRRILESINKLSFKGKETYNHWRTIFRKLKFNEGTVT